MRLALAAGLVVSMMARSPLPARAAAPPAVSEWTVISRMSPVFISDLAREMRANADGSESANHSGFMQVGMQRTSAYGIPAGVLSKDPAQIQKALDGIAYAFAHQHPDGSFDYSESNGSVASGLGRSPLGNALSTTFFLEDLGHAMLLLQASPWFMTSPATSAQRAQLEGFRKPATLALNWLLSQQSVTSRDVHPSNRIIAYGSAYYLLGKALGRADAMAVGRSFINRAIAMQLPDGTLPENGGFDSSYQNVSLYKLMVYYLNLAADDAYLRPAVWNAVTLGMKRELRNVQPDGTIVTMGNSRVGGSSGETYFGHAKPVDRPNAALSLEYYANITNDASVRGIADNVEHHYLETTQP
jgi:hypothetical protein